MPRDRYPGHEGGPAQTPEQAFGASYDALMAREPLRSGTLAIADVLVPDVCTIRTLRAYEPGLRHWVSMTVQTVGQSREVIVDVEVADGSAAGRGKQLLGVTYGTAPGPTGAKIVMAEISHFADVLSDADAAFVQAMGFGEALLGADQTLGGEMSHVRFDRYFPEAGEVAALASLPERANAYQA